MTLERTNVEARPPNWLPIPGEIVEEVSPEVEEDDLFPKGEVVSFYPRQGYGQILSSNGEKFIFRMEEVELVGPKGHTRYIVEGCRVGYDVGQTSGGMHVTKLKPY